MIRTEQFILDIPMTIYRDKALNWTDRAVYFFFVKYNGDSEKVTKELELSITRFKEIKQRLEKQGHISVILEGKRRKYVPLDAPVVLWGKLCGLRAASSIGFNTLTDSQIIVLQRKHTLQHIYQTISISEADYRRRDNYIENAYPYLVHMCKVNMRPPQEPFDYDWWQKDLEQKALVEKKKKSTRELEKQEKEELERQKDLDKRLDSLSEEEKAALRERAVESLKERGQWPLPFASEIGIRLMMKDIIGKEGGV